MHIRCKYGACISCMGYCLLILNMYMCAQDTLTSFTDITDTPIIGLQCYYQDIITLKNGSLGCGLLNIDYYSGLPFPFNLYCVNCSVTLDTEWTYHIGVDLDLQLSQEGGGSTVYVSDLLYCV